VHFPLKKYNEDQLLPIITNEVTLEYAGNNPRTSLWKTLYQNNPNNYWCILFAEKMKTASKDEIKYMQSMGEGLEVYLSEIINKNVNSIGEEADRLLFCLIRHLEFFHVLDEYFFDVLVELCERAEGFDKQMPWLDPLISSNPNFLKENPLIGMLSKKYNGIILNILKDNRDRILKGEFSVLRQS
jgi:hypothetical protein